MSLRALIGLVMFLCIPTAAAAAMVEGGVPSIAASQKGKLTGRVVANNGLPLAGGMIFLFNASTGLPPAPEIYWRVPDETASLDGEGRFSIDLMAGSYFIGVIKRTSGQDLGPPRDGDMFLVVRDSAGVPARHVVIPGKQANAGVLGGAVTFNRAMVEARPPGTTGIDGVILDTDGKPVSGVFVFAFTSQSMLGKPLFVSEKSGPDGRYLLRVAEGGTYYLKARDTCGGGPPRPGAILGGHGEEDPFPVVVRSGEIARGITVKTFMVPQRGRNKEENMRGQLHNKMKREGS